MRSNAVFRLIPRSFFLSLPLMAGPLACVDKSPDAGDAVGVDTGTSAADELDSSSNGTGTTTVDTGTETGTTETGTTETGTTETGTTDTTTTDTTTTDTTTTDTTTTDTTTTDTTTETGGTFIPDDSTTGNVFIIDDDMPPSECSPWLQDCPQGEKCVPIALGNTWDADACVPIQGTGEVGDPCVIESIQSGLDDCGAGLYCWGEQCTAICEGTPQDPLCPPGSACVIANDGVITLCVSNCDPLLQDCPPGQGCYWTANDFQCVFTTEDIPAGEPCGFINDCAPGNLCTDASSLPDCNGAACCTPYCDLTDPNACAGMPGLECVSFFEEGMAPPGYEDLGVCIMP